MATVIGDIDDFSVLPVRISNLNSLVLTEIK